MAFVESKNSAPSINKNESKNIDQRNKWMDIKYFSKFKNIKSEPKFTTNQNMINKSIVILNRNQVVLMKYQIKNFPDFIISSSDQAIFLRETLLSLEQPEKGDKYSMRKKWKLKKKRSKDKVLGSSLFLMNKMTNILHHIRDVINYEEPTVDQHVETRSEYLNSKNMKKLFEEYYFCLELRKQKHLSVLSKPNGLVEVIMVQNFEKVHLTCNTCISPTTDPFAEKSINWIHKKLNTDDFSIKNEFKKIDMDFELFLMNSKGDLFINGITTELTGMYVCLLRNVYESVYIIGVEIHEHKEKVSMDGSKFKFRPSVVLSYNNLFVYSHWTEWSECTHCNRIGLRKKYGKCTVEKLKINNPVKPQSSILLDSVSSGLPCSYPLLPSFIANLPAIKNRPTEIILDKCKVACPTVSTIDIVTDINGIVIESIAADKGRFSILKPLPIILPQIIREVVWVTFGKKVLLNCPSDVEENQSVLWFNKSMLISEKKITLHNEGRILITNKHTLVISKITYYDMGSYSCWIKGLQKAIFKIKIKDPISVEDFILGAFDVFGALVIIILCIYSIVKFYLLNKAPRNLQLYT